MQLKKYLPKHVGVTRRVKGMLECHVVREHSELFSRAEAVSQRIKRDGAVCELRIAVGHHDNPIGHARAVCSTQ